MCMNSRRQLGFTLIELIIFIVVVGAGLAGILTVSTTVVRSSADPMLRKQSLAIAESLLEEILLKEYAKPSGSTVSGFALGGARNLYDCVDDYATYATAAGIVDATGTAVVGLGNFNISPAVAVSTTAMGAVTVKRVVVSVTGPQGTFSLTGYRGNY
jgi:MSHA pilin protein MshD